MCELQNKDKELGSEIGDYRLQIDQVSQEINCLNQECDQSKFAQAEIQRMFSEETKAHETQMTEMQATLKKSMMMIKSRGI